jgi:hypothetical protein
MREHRPPGARASEVHPVETGRFHERAIEVGAAQIELAQVRTGQIKTCEGLARGQSLGNPPLLLVRPGAFAERSGVLEVRRLLVRFPRGTVRHLPHLVLPGVVQHRLEVACGRAVRDELVVQLPDIGQSPRGLRRGRPCRPCRHLPPDTVERLASSRELCGDLFDPLSPAGLGRLHVPLRPGIHLAQVITQQVGRRDDLPGTGERGRMPVGIQSLGSRVGARRFNLPKRLLLEAALERVSGRRLVQVQVG